MWSEIAEEIEGMERETAPEIVALLEAVKKERRLNVALRLPIWRQTAETLTRAANREWPNPLWSYEVDDSEEGEMVQERVQNLCILVDEVRHRNAELMRDELRHRKMGLHR